MDARVVTSGYLRPSICRAEVDDADDDDDSRVADVVRDRLTNPPGAQNSPRPWAELKCAGSDGILEIHVFWQANVFLLIIFASLRMETDSDYLHL